MFKHTKSIQSKTMRQPSMHNLTNDLAPTKQTLSETLEVNSDCIVPQSKSHSTKISVISSQAAIDNSTDTEQFSAQTSKDLTILQTASPTEVKNENVTTHTLSNPNSQDFSMLVVSVEGVSSLSQKTVVAEQIDSSSQPTHILEATNPTQDTIVQFFSKDDSKKSNAAGLTILQSNSNTIIQHSSTIYDSAEQKVYKAMSPLSTSLDRTILQSGKTNFSPSLTPTIVLRNRSRVRLFHPSIRNMFSTSGSFMSRFSNITRQFFNSIWRKINNSQLQSRFRSDRQLPGGNTLKQPSSNSSHSPTHNAILLDRQPSSEQYQKKLRELDLCRLNFAKELARNGNFRKAIAIAQQIPEMSYFFKDAQMLIQSWKQF